LPENGAKTRNCGGLLFGRKSKERGGTQTSSENRRVFGEQTKDGEAEILCKKPSRDNRFLKETWKSTVTGGTIGKVDKPSHGGIKKRGSGGREM